MVFINVIKLKSWLKILTLTSVIYNLIRGYFMKIDGEVTTGLGKAAYFLSQEFYTKEFKKNLGFVPYPGTLNVIVSEEYLDEINETKNSCENLIKPDEGFGAVKFIEAKLNDEIDGAIVFPAKTTHEENYLEFIAEIRLRDELDLNDGDTVSLEF
jgi:riboflavin kinase